MPRVEIYTIQFCPYCDAAKALLRREGIDFEEHDLSALSDDALHETLRALGGRTTAPQIRIDGETIGGYSDLEALHRKKPLREALASS